MSGFDREDKEDRQSYQKMVALCVAAASLVLLIFLVVLLINSEDKKEKKPLKAEIENEEEDILKDANNIRSEDLGFWKNYESVEDLEQDNEENTTQYRKGERNINEEESADGVTDENNADSNDSDDNAFEDGSVDASDNSENDGSFDSNIKKKKVKKDKNGLEKSDEEEESDSMTKNPDDDPDTVDNDENATHIAVVDDKGIKKLYEILSQAEKHSYDLKDKITRTEDGRLSYEDDELKAKVGIDLSKYNGTVDWEKVKEDNIDFAMLRIAARGYENGSMILDEKFVEYAQGAKMCGIPIGVYVFSQATSDVEAVEEANYAVGAITNFDVSYPIAIDIEVSSTDNYRANNISAKDRTHYAKLFCDTVASYGYHPMIYANRDLLISGINLEELQGYDIWIADENVPTDFPYRFNMWQYDTKGSVSGIATDVDIDLSFEYKSR